MITNRPTLVQLTIRLLIAASPLFAIASIRAADSEPILLLEIVVLWLALACAVLPDTHLGLLLVVAVGVNWLLAIDDPTTPWAIAVAVSLALFHSSMAAAALAPMAAAWTAAMCRRWSRRSLIVAAASVPMWGLTFALDSYQVVSSPALVALALVVLAIGVLWARYGSLDIEPRA